MSKGKVTKIRFMVELVGKHTVRVHEELRETEIEFSAPGLLERDMVAAWVAAAFTDRLTAIVREHSGRPF